MGRSFFWVANGIRTRTKRSTISRANPYTIATIDLRGPLMDFLECCKRNMRLRVGAKPGLWGLGVQCGLRAPQELVIPCDQLGAKIRTGSRNDPIGCFEWP